MQTDEFEWDDDKAAQNVAKHRITFEQATFAFDDRQAFEEDDVSMRYGELRTKRIALSGQRLLVVIYTERRQRIRIVSAREAEPHEHVIYDLNR
jgi:uncharacterized protein